jgi:hypothetical protein
MKTQLLKYQEEYLNIVAVFTYITKNLDHICLILLKQQSFNCICKELEKQIIEKNVCFRYESSTSPCLGLLNFLTLFKCDFFLLLLLSQH